MGVSASFIQPIFANGIRETNMCSAYNGNNFVGPSDYDVDDLASITKAPTTDTNEDDQSIRDELKRELLLLASVSCRGDFATHEENDILNDIVTQLEALNPYSDPASQCVGEWDLTLASTQAFRSSPFFQAVRVVLNDGRIAENIFNIHEAATSMGKVARVRQLILSDGSLTSEVDLEVGIMKGTVVTKAFYEVVGSISWDVRITTTEVKNSNVPFLAQFVKDFSIEFPVGDLYDKVRGSVPVSKLTTYYGKVKLQNS